MIEVRLHFSLFFCCCLICYFHKDIQCCLCLSHKSTYFLQCFSLDCSIHTCLFYSKNCISQCLCIFDKCRQELLACHIDHCTCLDIDCLCICLILDFRTRLQLCLCKYIESLKQLDGLICCNCRDCIYHGLNIRKSSSLSLCNPLIRISISIEDDSLIVCQILFDQVMYCKIKVICLLKEIARICKCFSNDRIKYNVRICDGIS